MIRRFANLQADFAKGRAGDFKVIMALSCLRMGLLACHREVARMKILLTGASGLIGSALGKNLSAEGHEVVPLVRHREPAGASWDPARGEIHLAPAGKLDAVIHLAGENVAQRWTAAARERIYQSRVSGTRLLSEALAALREKPRVLLCASGTAAYGSRGDEILDEGSTPGEGFLTKVVHDWEAASAPARDAGIRIVHLRLGMVLHPSGGALAKMLPAFRLGVGGKLGPGTQYWSWITLDDAVRAIGHCLTHENIKGAVNVVSPNPVTNSQFTKSLGAALRRPTWFAAPAFALKMVFGEMADETMFTSFRVLPKRLEETGFRFEHPELKAALTQLLR